MPARRQGRRGERGAAMVEAVLIIPLIVLLTFGAIEFGFAFNTQDTIRSATRNGARAASTQPKVPAADFEAAAMDALSASVDDLVSGTPLDAWVYEPNADGSRPAACAANCASYQWDGDAFTIRTGGAGWEPEARHACAGEADRVAVWVRIDYDWLTGLPWSGDGDIRITSNSIMALEPAVGVPCEATA